RVACRLWWDLERLTNCISRETERRWIESSFRERPAHRSRTCEQVTDFRKEEAMWTKRRVRTRGILGAGSLAIVMTAGAAWADVTTERPGSILILPKIVADGTRDTLIEVSNATNSLTTAHCFYVNGGLLDPSAPPGPFNPPQWQEIDFILFLTR